MMPAKPALPLLADARAASPEPPAIDRERFGQVVLVLQGGGALGAYQGGVFQALAEAGVTPDWVIGTSIGAINAALIAGNAPGQRLQRMTEFWSGIRQAGLAEWASALPFVGPALGKAAIVAGGLPGVRAGDGAAGLERHRVIQPHQHGGGGGIALGRDLQQQQAVILAVARQPLLALGTNRGRVGRLRDHVRHRQASQRGYVRRGGRWFCWGRCCFNGWGSDGGGWRRHRVGRAAQGVVGAAGGQQQQDQEAASPQDRGPASAGENSRHRRRRARRLGLRRGRRLGRGGNRHANRRVGLGGLWRWRRLPRRRRPRPSSGSAGSGFRRARRARPRAGATRRRPSRRRRGRRDSRGASAAPTRAG